MAEKLFKAVVTMGESPDDPAFTKAGPDVRFVFPQDREDARREAVDADILWGFRFVRDVIECGERLRWVQAGTAGTERQQGWLREFSRSDVLLTSAAGVYAVPIAEHVFGMLISLRRSFPKAWQLQQESRWGQPEQTREVTSSTIGIVGLGAIGREVARIAKQGFCMRVLAHKRRRSEGVDHVDQLFYGREGLHDMLRQADVVVVAAALTEQTRGLVGGAALDCLSDHALLINVARGAVVDQPAMIERLQDGRLSAAGLDVFEPEPLPEESPLWRLPNVFLTCHYSGASGECGRRRKKLFCENLLRWRSGQPLLNQVDLQAGY